MIQLKVNGVERSFDGDPEMPRWLVDESKPGVQDALAALTRKKSTGGGHTHARECERH